MFSDGNFKQEEWLGNKRKMLCEIFNWSTQFNFTDSNSNDFTWLFSTFFSLFSLYFLPCLTYSLFLSPPTYVLTLFLSYSFSEFLLHSLSNFLLSSSLTFSLLSTCYLLFPYSLFHSLLTPLFSHVLLTCLSLFPFILSLLFIVFLSHCYTWFISLFSNFLSHPFSYSLFHAFLFSAAHFSL